MSEEAEKYIILLLGAKNTPMPSLWHLQKEMFVLSRAIPMINEFFDFERHYNGPFSPILSELVKEPLTYDDAFEMRQQNGPIQVTRHGKEVFKKIVNEHQNNEKFSYLLKTIKLTRDVYDKLEKDELLFLFYQTYPEYAEVSNAYHSLVLDQETRTKMADSLLAKNLVTEERCKELKEIVKRHEEIAR